jgi:hypothetical protein
MPTTTFANGNTLTSSALSQTDAEDALQALITSILGAGTDPNTGVRISWPTGGSPGWLITDEVCFLRATLSGERINRSRDKNTSGTGASLTETVTYIRVWDIDLILYGPNSFDRARLIKSALFMDWVSTALAANSLAVVIDIEDPRRMPELFSGQWWERSDISFRMNELVTEISQVPAMVSVEVDLYTEDTSVSQPVAVITHQ